MDHLHTPHRMSNDVYLRGRTGVSSALDPGLETCLQTAPTTASLQDCEARWRNMLLL